MSESPGSVPGSANKATSSHGSESSGFKSFWKRSDKGSQQQNVTFVQQDPSTKKSKASKSFE